MALYTVGMGAPLSTPVARTDPNKKQRPAADRPSAAEPGGPGVAAPAFMPGPVPGLIHATPVRGGTAPAVIRRDIVIGTGLPPTGKTYRTGNLEDRKRIGEQAGNLDTSTNKPLARRLARWMLDQGHAQTFASNDKLRAYVDEMVRAITATGPNHWIGNDYQEVPNPFPAANTFSPDGYGNVNKIVRQVPQERGDMHDVRVALALDPLLHVAVTVSDSRQLADAAIIIEYYRGFGSRVGLTCGAGWGAYAAKTRSASSTTEILFRAAQAGDISNVLQQQTTGGAHATYAAAYDTVLTGLHFPDVQPGTPYALINFRVSGHGVTGTRAPSHPELDTGVAGFAQLWNAAKNSGYWPVPVGSVRPDALADCRVPGGTTFSAAKHPHLIDYFRHVGPVAVAAAGAGLSKRQIEYGIFGRMAAKFPGTRAIGMRSGGLDAIAYAGIPSISVDLAAEYDPNVALLNPAHGHASSWKRAAKKELLLPGRFHQVFMSALRPLGNLASADWQGTLSDDDVTRISTALTTFFGGWGDAGTTTHALTDQPVPDTAPNLLPQDVRNLMTKLQNTRPGVGLPISHELADALGIRAF